MEERNWIKAYFRGEEVWVRQTKACSDIFEDDNGNRYHIGVLDFTRNTFEPALFDLSEIEKRIDESDKQFKANQERIDKMLASIDAKAKIDESEYWRKLRGDITLELIRQGGASDYYGIIKNIELIASKTEALFDCLYKQHEKFLRDTEND